MSLFPTACPSQRPVSTLPRSMTRRYLVSATPGQGKGSVNAMWNGCKRTVNALATAVLPARSTQVDRLACTPNDSLGSARLQLELLVV